MPRWQPPARPGVTCWLAGPPACLAAYKLNAAAGSAPTLDAPAAHRPPQIPASDIVGATTSGSQLVIWHAPLATKAGAEKPVRRVRRSPPLLLDGGPAAAEQAAAHLRRTCCWRGRPAPPRLLVVVNPASGPGK